MSLSIITANFIRSSRNVRNVNKATAKRRYLPEGGTPKIKKQIYVRYRYAHHWDFLLSCLGASIGRGNMWRFPALAAEYGGLPFLIASFVMMIGVSIPMRCVEMFLGQLSGLGVAKTLGLMSPLFHGVGWAMICLTFLQSIRVGVLLGYSTLYLSMSFKGDLPWTRCNQSWNTHACRQIATFYECKNLIEPPSRDSECYDFYNENITQPIPPTIEFFFNYILDTGHGRGDNSPFFWQLTLSLFFTYTLIFVCLMFGIKISSKMVYVTVTFPYLGLLLIVIVCLKQEGASIGMKSFFTSDYKVLLGWRIWYFACAQMIWTSYLGTGVMTALTSYNPFHNDCRRDSVILGICNLFINFLASLCLFAAAGVIVKDLEMADTNFLREYLGGIAVAFVVYPELISHVRGAVCLTILFFFVLIVLLLNTEIWLVETCVTEIADVYKPCRFGRGRIVLVGLYCGVSCIVSVIIFYIKGNNILNLNALQHETLHYSLIFLTFLEVVAVFYIYGYRRFEEDVRLIVGSIPNVLWRILFLFTAPMILVIMLIVSLADYRPSEFRKRVTGPVLSYNVTSLLVEMLSLCFVIAFPAYRIIKRWIKKRRVITLLMPSRRWCPRKKADLENQREEILAAEEGIMGDVETSSVETKNRSIISK